MRFHSNLFVVMALVFSLPPAFGLPLAMPWDAPRFREKGPLQYAASLETLYQWDSNIRHQAGKGKQDHIAIVRPSVAGRLVGYEDSFLSGSYQFEGERFAKTLELNAANHLADVRGRLGWRRGYLTAGERYARTNDRANTVFTDRIRREDNTIRAGLGLLLADWTPELNGEMFKRIYNDSNLPGYSSWAVEPRLMWSIDEQNGVSVRTRWERINYPEQTARDGTVYEGDASWVYSSPGSGVRLDARVGVQNRVYRGSGVSDYMGPIGEANARYIPRGRLALFVGGALKVFEAPIEPPSAYYRQLSMNAGLEYPWSDRLSSVVSQSLASQRYGDNAHRSDFTGQRRDTTASASFEQRYRFDEVVSLSAGASWEERSSNVASLSYHGFIITFGCKLEI